MTYKEIVAAQVNHEETEFVPYTLSFNRPALRLMNDYFGNEEWQKKILPCIDLIYGTFDSWDNLTYFDPNNPYKCRDPFGNIFTKTDKIVHLDKGGMEDTEIYDYKWPTLEDFWTPEKEQMIMKRATENPDQYKIVSLGAGWYENSWRLVGVENALIMCLAEPEKYEFMIDGLDKLINQFVDVLVKLPVDGILISDDWCDQRHCTMGPDRWREFIKPRLAKIYEKVHKSGKKMFNHVCGSVAPLIPDLIEIGLDVLESVQPEAADMNPYELKKKYGKDLAFWGGLGCQSMITYGTPAQNQMEIRKLRKEMSVGGGYILAPSKVLNESCSIENMLAIYEAFTEENDKMLNALL